MSEQKHTSEPWTYRKSNRESGKRPLLRIFQRGSPIPVAGVHRMGGSEQMADFNADRIVACVNALAGIPTEELEAGIVGEMADWLERWLLCDTDTEAMTLIENGKAILARLGRAP